MRIINWYLLGGSMANTLKRLFVALSCAVAGASATAAAFSQGNLFVSTGVGTVVEYTATGTAVQTLNVGTGFITGSTFDAAGNFYATRFSNGALQKFNADGTSAGAFASGLSSPESVVIDAAGNIYVGSVGGGIRKYDSTGALLSTSLGTTRIDFMDLSADQSTMLYTQEGNQILRVNVATNTGLSAFSTAVDQAFALRIRSNGQVLVADGGDIELLNADGTDNRTYDIASAGLWFALNLDADGTSFWSATTDGLIAHFDIASGNLLGSFNVTGTNGVWGLSLLGEQRQGCGTNCGGGGGNVPEPESVMLLGIGLIALGAARRIRRRA